MTATAVAERGSAVAGTVRLIVLALRRDRVRLSVWVGALTAMMVYAPIAVRLAYPDEAQRRSRVELLKTPAGILLGGPMFGGDETDLGVMMANELMLSLIVATAILSVLTVVRHTRAEEEGGVAELVAAAPVGRQARTAAALAVMAGANALLTLTMTAAMTAVGFAVTDSLGMVVGMTAAATGAALGVLAVAVLVRGIGDVVHLSGSTLSWFSPIAWAQQMRAFVDLRWWPLLPLLALSTVLVAAAAALEARREYDDGVVGTRGERPRAGRIRGVVHLHAVLQRGTTAGWAVGLFVSGLAVGSMTQALLDAASGNALLARVLSAQGVDGIATTMTQFLAAAATAAVTSSVLRLHGDERSGLAEAVLAGSVSRWRWLASAVVTSVAAAGVLMLCAGVGNGLGLAVATGDPHAVSRLTAAGLAYVPALAVVAGVAALAVAVRRPGIGWAAVAFVVISLYFGALLRLPRWLLDLSPVVRTTAPSAVSPGPLAIMALVAAALTAAAGVVYRRRDAA